METGVRIELTYNSFAESGLTTWLTRHKMLVEPRKVAVGYQPTISSNVANSFLSTKLVVSVGLEPTLFVFLVKSQD